MSKIKAVIFDMWDTLIYNDKNENIMLTLSSLMNIPPIRENWKHLEKAFMLKHYRTLEEAVADIAAYFHTSNHFVINKIKTLIKNALKPRIFPDVIPVLKKLKERNYKLAIVSNTPSFGIKCLHSSLFRYFDAVCLSCDLGIIKPDKRIFLTALKRLGTKPEETIMVGDNYQDDIKPAISIGMNAVLVKRNFNKLTWRETHDYGKTINSLKGIWKFL